MMVSMIEQANEYYKSIHSRIEAAEERIAELEAALDEKEVASGLTSNGNLWRFWSKKASELAVKNADLERKLADYEAFMIEFADNTLRSTMESSP